MPAERQTKGQRTAERILDSAEELFARRGYDGTSLRQIAQAAGIREPGLYNHFAGKRELYRSVLLRSLTPLTDSVSTQLDEARGLHDYTELPALLTDLLAERPHLAALLQQAVQDTGDGEGQRVLQGWLGEVFDHGLHDMAARGLAPDSDRATLALNLIALVNLTAGYFLSGQAFARLAGGEVQDPDNVARQKQLLHKVIRAMLIN